MGETQVSRACPLIGRSCRSKFSDNPSYFHHPEIRSVRLRHTETQTNRKQSNVTYRKHRPTASLWRHRCREIPKRSPVHDLSPRQQRRACYQKDRGPGCRLERRPRQVSRPPPACHRLTSASETFLHARLLAGGVFEVQFPNLHILQIIMHRFERSFQQKLVLKRTYRCNNAQFDLYALLIFYEFSGVITSTGKSTVERRNKKLKPTGLDNVR